MPLFPGVGRRVAERLLALGYKRVDGKPDVRRFVRERGWDKTSLYFWLSDRNTPTKELGRLARDLGVTPAWLLFGEGKPKKPPAMAGGSDQESPKGQPPRRIMLSTGSWLPLPAGHFLSVAAYRLAA